MRSGKKGCRHRTKADTPVLLALGQWGQVVGKQGACSQGFDWIYPEVIGHRKQGLLKGLLAAVTFGLSASLISTLTSTGSPLALAGLLYGGSAMALLTARAVRGQSTQESSVKRQDLGMLASLTLIGGIAAAESRGALHDGNRHPGWQGTPERQRHCCSGTDPCWSSGHRGRHRFRNHPSWSGVDRPAQISWCVSADAVAGRTDRGKVSNTHRGRGAPGDWRDRIWTLHLVGSAGAAGVGRCQGISDLCDSTFCWSRFCCACTQGSSEHQPDRIRCLDDGRRCSVAAGKPRPLAPS